MFKYVLFDCDGVLVDSEYVACHLLTEMLKPFGCPITPEEMMEKHVGMKDNEIVRILSEQHALRLPTDFMATYAETLDAALEKNLPSIAGIHQVLQDLKVPRAIVSNSHFSRIVTSLKTTQLSTYFNQSEITSADLANAAKPDPAIYQYALTKMKWKAEEVVVIEDSPTGVAAAHGAGIKVIGFMGASHTTKDHETKLLKSGAWKIAHNSSELDGLLNEFCR
jgi:HAD superfamily hydrolase (TIGR01509 family)